MDNVGIVVEDMDAAAAFFEELGSKVPSRSRGTDISTGPILGEHGLAAECRCGSCRRSCPPGRACHSRGGR
jgi:hypothetical protein